MTPEVWARIKALRPAPPRVIWSSSGYVEVRDPLTGDLMPQKRKVSIDGTYRQPDNNRRLKRLAIRDHGFRQFKKKGVLRQYNIAQREASNA